METKRSTNFKKVDTLLRINKNNNFEKTKQSFSAEEIIKKELLTKSATSPSKRNYLQKAKPVLAFLFTYAAIMILVISFLQPDIIMGKKNTSKDIQFKEESVKVTNIKNESKIQTIKKANNSTEKKITKSNTTNTKNKSNEKNSTKNSSSTTKLAIGGSSQITGWEKKTSGTTEDLLAVAVGDQNTAWAVGKNGVICKTTDGGSTWTAQTYTPTGGGSVSEFIDISAVDTNNVWILGYVTGTSPASNNIILKSTNGGNTWTQYLDTNLGTSKTLTSISAGDANNIWAVGMDGTITHTSDGGSNWTLQSLPGGATTYLYDVEAVNKDVVWTGGDGGNIYKTTNSGTSWTLQNSEVTTTIQQFSAVNENVVWARYIADDKLLKTIDGGTNWTTVSFQPFLAYAPSYISAVDQNVVWGVMHGEINYTSDGYTQNYSYESTDVYLTAIDAISQNKAIAVGNGGGIILATPPSPPPSPGPEPEQQKQLVTTGSSISVIGLFVVLIMLSTVLFIKKKRI